MVVVRLSPALPSVVAYSKNETKILKILDSGDQCKIRLNAATKYRQLYKVFKGEETVLKIELFDPKTYPSLASVAEFSALKR